MIKAVITLLSILIFSSYALAAEPLPRGNVYLTDEAKEVIEGNFESVEEEVSEVKVRVVTLETQVSTLQGTTFGPTWDDSAIWTE